MIFTQQAAPTQHNTAGGTSGAGTGHVCGRPCFFLEQDELSGFAAAFPARDSLVSDPSTEAVCFAAQRLEQRAQGSQRTHVPGGLGWVLLGTALEKGFEYNYGYGCIFGLLPLSGWR